MANVRRIGAILCEEIEVKSLLNRVRGMPFDWSINPYRGCYHRCVFCYARNTHAYLDRDGVRDWGTKLSAKINAPSVLRHELATTRRAVDRVCLGTATDPYQPLEGSYRITRQILEILARSRIRAHLITRSPLVVRDIDMLAHLSERAGVTGCVSLPTLDEQLAGRIEPTVAAPRQRLRAIALLARAGIRVGVAVAPVLPGLTDAREDLRAVFSAAADAGASMAWHSVLNLNETARESYFAFLHAEFPALVADNDAMFRRKYAPANVVTAIDARVREARTGIDLCARRTIRAAPAPHQLSLITSG